MISFRCWYCNKSYLKAEDKAGDEFVCSCKNTLRVPKRSGGNSRVKTLTDRLVETVVYGGAGAVLGFGLAFVLLAQFWVVPGRFGIRVAFLAGMTLLGFLLGLFGGEAGVNWIGRIIRDRQERK